MNTNQEITELRARVKTLEARATCPHIVSSDEGTSYCGLAEQTATSQPASAAALAPAGGLVELVAGAITADRYADPYLYLHEARAAIREVAAWLEQRTCTIANGSQWADMLRQEAEQ
jgi:hypothetical protein